LIIFGKSIDVDSLVSSLLPIAIHGPVLGDQGRNYRNEKEKGDLPSHCRRQMGIGTRWNMEVFAIKGGVTKLTDATQSR